MHRVREHIGRPVDHYRHHPRSGELRSGEEAPLHHRHRGGRARRGDVRTAVLLLLAEEPMHGYQLMQAIADRSGGRWAPSPGAIYPTINQLEDEGLVAVTVDAGRRLVTLTDAGREQVHTRETAGSDPFAGYSAAGPGADLRELLHQLHAAARQVARAGTDTQRARAATILAEARRALYLLLAEGPETSDGGPASRPPSS